MFNDRGGTFLTPSAQQFRTIRSTFSVDLCRIFRTEQILMSYPVDRPEVHRNVANLPCIRAGSPMHTKQCWGACRARGDCVRRCTHVVQPWSTRGACVAHAYCTCGARVVHACACVVHACVRESHAIRMHSAHALRAGVEQP